MFGTSARIGAALAIVMILASCGSGITSPTPALSTSTSTVVPPPTPDRTPLGGPARVFVFDRGIGPVSSYTLTSRFVLYDSGAYVLEYPSLSERGYRGRYKHLGSEVAFQWDDSNTGVPWGAVGRLEGGVLSVEYNLIMQLDGFENAVYILTQ